MKKSIILLVLLSLQLPQAMAKDVGVIGPVYPIIETDFLQWIQQQVQEKVKNGEFEKWQAAQLQNAEQQADRPEPVIGLTKAQQTRSWLYDLTLTLHHDLLDTQGNIRLPAGTRVNPLDTVLWTQTLVFYNGDDAAQVAWVKTILQQSLQGRVMLMLTRGSVSEQIKLFNQRVYFDQGGQLVQRLGITHVPASVAQDGKQLRITEVRI